MHRGVEYKERLLPRPKNFEKWQTTLKLGVQESKKKILKA